MADENPFVQEEDGSQDQYCWRDGSRMCQGECVAYDDRCQADPVWSPCILLNIQRAQAKSHANLAAELKRYNDIKQEEKDKIREAFSHIKPELVTEPGERRNFASKEEAEAYAQKLKEMDKPPPEIKT